MAVDDWEHYPKYKTLSENLIAAIQAKIRGEATEADVQQARQKLDDFWDEVED